MEYKQLRNAPFSLLQVYSAVPLDELVASTNAYTYTGCSITPRVFGVCMIQCCETCTS